MKRLTYEITVEGMPPAKAHAWNSALRAMDAQVRALLSPDETATRARTWTVKLDRWTTASGSFTYTVSPSGREIAAKIQLLDQP